MQMQESVIKISTAPEPTATPDPKTVDPDAVTTNGNLTMVNEYLAENGSEVGVTRHQSGSRTPVIQNRINLQIHTTEIVQMVLTAAMIDNRGDSDIPMKTVTTAAMMIQGKDMMENKAKKPLELYIHVPFCVKKCDYCDFLSGPAEKRRRQIFPGSFKEIASVPDFQRTERSLQFLSAEERLPCRIAVS